MKHCFFYQRSANRLFAFAKPWKTVEVLAFPTIGPDERKFFDLYCFAFVLTLIVN